MGQVWSIAWPLPNWLFGADFNTSETVVARVRHRMVKGYEIYYQVAEANYCVLARAARST